MKYNNYKIPTVSTFTDTEPNFTLETEHDISVSSLLQLESIGDSIIIKANYPVFEILTTVSFVDVVNNTTGTRLFTKEFRYSVNGIDWSDWTALTNPNLIGLSFGTKEMLIIEYKYSRSGADATSYIEFESITLTGTFDKPTVSRLYQNSNFYTLFDLHDGRVLNWAVNVMQKMYDENTGVPAYIERTPDLIVYLTTVAHFFALSVQYMREIGGFTDNTQLLSEYLIQKGIYVCDQASLVDLQYIMNNFYDEIRQRGTSQIYKPKEASVKDVDGELLRLICHGECDEFIFALFEKEKSNWYINQGSPLYQGNRFAFGFIKGYEFSQDAVSLTPYPLIESGRVSIDTDAKGEVILIDNVDINDEAGIGVTTIDVTKAINVDVSLDYEITFEIKQVELLDNITFGVSGFDCAGTTQIDFLEVDSLATTSNLFFSKKQLNRNDIWYQVRGIIYNKDKAQLTTPQALLNIGFGNNLVFQDGVEKIVPYLVIENDGSIPPTVIETDDFSNWSGVDPNELPNGWTHINTPTATNKVRDNGSQLEIVCDGTQDMGIQKTFSGTAGIPYRLLADAVSATGGTSIYFQIGINNTGVSSGIMPTTASVDYTSGSFLVRIFMNQAGVGLVDNYELQSLSAGEIRIYDFKIRPLKLDYQLGFIENPNWIHTWLENNNGRYTEEEITEIMERYLIPYNSTLKNNFIT